MQNGFVESFNGRLRGECPNEHHRPHSSLNGLTPTELAARPVEGNNRNRLSV